MGKSGEFLEVGGRGALVSCLLCGHALRSLDGSAFRTCSLDSLDRSAVLPHRCSAFVSGESLRLAAISEACRSASSPLVRCSSCRNSAPVRSPEVMACVPLVEYVRPEVSRVCDLYELKQELPRVVASVAGN